MFGGYRLFGPQSLVRNGLEAVKDRKTFRARYFSIVASHLGYPSWAKLFRRALVCEHEIRYNTIQKCCEDHTFNVECYRHVETVAMIPCIVYEYNSGNGASVTKRYDPNYGTYRMLEFETVYEWMADDRALVIEQAAEAFRGCLNLYLRYCSRLMPPFRLRTVIAPLWRFVPFRLSS